MRRPSVFINGIAARQGGGVTYLNSILGLFAERNDADIDVYGFSRIEPALRSAANIRVVDLPMAHRNILYRYLVEKFFFPTLILAKRYDVAYFPNGMVSGYVPPSTRSVTMFQNMLPFSERDVAKFPIGYDKLRYRLLRRAYLKSYRTADEVIFISRYARDVIARLVPGVEGRSSVIPHGIPENFRGQRKVDPAAPLLYVSILNEYKHQIEIVRGLALYRERHGRAPRLRLAGFVKRSYLERLQRAVKELRLEGVVEILGPVPHAELPALYRDSGWVVFGSTCENCPTILLEAMGSSSPIICSSYQPMPEFLGDAGVYFDPERPESFAGALETAMSLSPEEVQARADMSYRLAGRYDWRKTAEDTYKVWTGRVRRPE